MIFNQNVWFWVCDHKEFRHYLNLYSGHSLGKCNQPLYMRTTQRNHPRAFPSSLERTQSPTQMFSTSLFPVFRRDVISQVRCRWRTKWSVCLKHQSNEDRLQNLGHLFPNFKTIRGDLIMRQNTLCTTSCPDMSTSPLRFSRQAQNRYSSNSRDSGTPPLYLIKNCFRFE